MRNFWIKTKIRIKGQLRLGLLGHVVAGKASAPSDSNVKTNKQTNNNNNNNNNNNKRDETNKKHEAEYQLQRCNSSS